MTDRPTTGAYPVGEVARPGGEHGSSRVVTLAEAIAYARAGGPVEGYLLDMSRDRFPYISARLDARPAPARGEDGGGARHA